MPGVPFVGGDHGPFGGGGRKELLGLNRGRTYRGGLSLTETGGFHVETGRIRSVQVVPPGATGDVGVLTTVGPTGEPGDDRGPVMPDPAGDMRGDVATRLSLFPD